MLGIESREYKNETLHIGKMPKTKEDYIIAALSGLLANPNIKEISQTQGVADAAVSIGLRTFEKARLTTKPQPKKKPTEEKQEIPSIESFMYYAQTQYKELGKEFEPFEYGIRAKYAEWVASKWKDGHGKPIKNWKTKLQNVLPHIKGVYKDKKQEEVKKLPQNKTLQ